MIFAPTENRKRQDSALREWGWKTGLAGFFLLNSGMSIEGRAAIAQKVRREPGWVVGPERARSRGRSEASPGQRLAATLLESEVCRKDFLRLLQNQGDCQSESDAEDINSGVLILPLVGISGEGKAICSLTHDRSEYASVGMKVLLQCGCRGLLVDSASCKPCRLL